MIRILITGASGQLGQSFRKVSALYPQLECIFADRLTLDICDPAAIHHFFAEGQFDFCINCAAYTAVDKAESEKSNAFRINRDAVGLLAAACQQNDCFFIHFSTDYVYATLSNLPLREDTPVLPTGVYGASKRAGELAAFWRQPETMVIRTSWVYSEFGNNFMKTMLRLASERDSLQVVYDQTGSPTLATDLAAAVLTIIADYGHTASGKKLMQGLFNYSNEGVCSWYDFAKAIFDISGTVCQVQPILSGAFKTAALRPPYSVLDKAKIKKTFGLDIPYWRDSLENCLKKV